MAKRGSTSKAERLQALRERIMQQDTGGGGGFLRLEEGRNQVRILPETGDMDIGCFFQPVGVHYFPDKRRVYCPSFTSEGELPCPVCEFVQELYNAGDQASTALAGQIRVRRQFWMNAVSRARESDGPLILTAGITIFSAIQSLIADPDYGDITDPDEGVDLKISREGIGLNTNYDVIAARYDSPLSKDSAQVEEWLEKARDLSYVEVSEDPSEDKTLAKGHAVYILPYDRIVDEFDLDAILDTDVEKEEEPAPRRSSRKSKPKEEVYGDEEDETPEVVKEVRRRRARRR